MSDARLSETGECRKALQRPGVPDVYVNVTADVDPEDVLSEMSDHDLAEYMASRTKSAKAENPMLLLERIYEEYRRRGDAIPLLREYLYEMLGRVL